jgi:hypothetical protein
MLLDHDFLAEWERIVNDVDKNQCPLECVSKVVFRTHDRRQKTINLVKLRQQGFDNESINEAVETFIQENDDLIASMEFKLDVKAVAGIVQPETDKLLKRMK